jgi:large conductance mechanosensitive channel
MKKFFKEFREFLNRGNVLDLAVGVIIGAAFKDIVNSLVNDIISPIIGIVFKADFKDLVWNMFPKVDELGAPMLDEKTGEQVYELSIRYGAFITAIINFIIMAFVIFMIVKAVNKLMSLGKKKEEPAAPAAPTTKKCPYCCTEIAIEATRCPHCTSQISE